MSSSVNDARRPTFPLSDPIETQASLPKGRCAAMRASPGCRAASIANEETTPCSYRVKPSASHGFWAICSPSSASSSQTATSASEALAWESSGGASNHGRNTDSLAAADSSAVGVGVAVGSGVGDAVGVGVGVAVGSGVAVAVGSGVAVGAAVASGVDVGSGAGVDDGCGVGAAATTATAVGVSGADCAVGSLQAVTSRAATTAQTVATTRMYIFGERMSDILAYEFHMQTALDED